MCNIFFYSDLMYVFIYLTGDFIHKLFEDNAFVPTDVAAGK